MAVKGFPSPTAVMGAAVWWQHRWAHLMHRCWQRSDMPTPTHFPSHPSQFLWFRYSRTRIPLSHFFFFLVYFWFLTTLLSFLHTPMLPWHRVHSTCSGTDQHRKGAAGLHTEPNHISKQHHFPFWGLKPGFLRKNATFQSSKNHVMQPLIRISRQIWLER